MSNENKSLTDLEEEAVLICQEARKNLLTFSQCVDKTYIANWHHYLIAQKLEEVFDKIKKKEKVRLMINLPPRAGKSRLATQLFPAWALGKYPELEFMVTSYSADLAKKFGLATKDVMNNEHYQAIFPGVRLRKDSKAKSDWKVNQGGSYHAVGVGGSLTGMGANCVLPYCQVNTPRGKIDISKLKVNDIIYGYKNGQIVETRIAAVSASKTIKPLKQIGKLECTEDHRIYTNEQGYTPAKDITSNMSFVWWEKGISRNCLYGVLSKIKSTAKNINMRLLLAKISKTPVRNRKSRKTNGANKSSFLFSRLLQKFSTGTQKQNAARARSLPTVSKNNLFKKKESKVLFFRVLSKSKGYIIKGLSLLGSIFTFKSRSCRQGQSTMSIVWKKFISNSNTSHRSRQHKPNQTEHDIAMSTLSQQISCVPGTCADDIKELLKSEGEYVVDIQTETENFFAEDVLVHNCAIIDDPIKNREEAESKLMRDKVYDWYTSTLYTRLQGHGAVIVILTRWHDDDLAGKLLYEDEQRRERGEQTEDWEVLKFPALATHDEDWGEGITRKEGEVLWPRFFDKKKMLDTKDMVGLYDWAALYQQDPVLAETQEFNTDMFHYFTDEDIKDKNLSYYTMVDPAISQKESADNTVVLTVGKDRNGPNWYRVREDAGHYTPGQTVDLIFKHQQTYRSEVWLETVAYQKALKYSVEEEQRKRQVYFKVEEVKSTTKKEFRIRGLLPLYERGVIFHRQTDKEYELELLTFPRGRRDDRIDAMGMALDAVQNTRYTKRKIKVPQWIGYGRLRRN